MVKENREPKKWSCPYCVLGHHFCMSDEPICRPIGRSSLNQCPYFALCVWFILVSLLCLWATPIVLSLQQKCNFNKNISPFTGTKVSYLWNTVNLSLDYWKKLLFRWGKSKSCIRTSWSFHCGKSKPIIGRSWPFHWGKHKPFLSCLMEQVGPFMGFYWNKFTLSLEQK